MRHATDQTPTHTQEFPNRNYLTKRELAARSGVSASTLQRYKDQGRIPFFQPGGKKARVLFPLNALEIAASAAANENNAIDTQPSGTAGAITTPKRLPGPCPQWRKDINP